MQEEAERPSFCVDLCSSSVPLEQKLSVINKLVREAEAMRRVDDLRLQEGLELLLQCSNWLPSAQADGAAPGALSAADRARALHFFLERYAALEARVPVELLIGALLSTDAAADLARVNVFLTPDVTEELLALVAVAILHSVRIGHVNRVLLECRKIAALVREGAEGGYGDGVRARLVQRVEALGVQLRAERHYIDRGTLEFDPRYLVFEFTWNLMLFGKQVARQGTRMWPRGPFVRVPPALRQSFVPRAQAPADGSERCGARQCTGRSAHTVQDVGSKSQHFLPHGPPDPMVLGGSGVVWRAHGEPRVVMSRFTWGWGAGL